MNDFVSPPVLVKRAHKSHVCSWCGHAINSGEQYYKYAVISDGSFLKVKLHPECHDAAEKEEGEWFFYQQQRGSND